MKRKALFLTALLFSFAAFGPHGPQAYAATLADYNFTTDLSSSDTDPNSTASVITAGAGFDIPASWGRSSAANNFFVRGNITGTTEAGAISANDYFTFTLAPDSGYMANLTQLSFNYGAQNNNFTTNIAIRSSVDSFGSNLGSVTYTGTNNSTAAGQGPYLIDLVVPAFQSLSTPVLFRFYIYDNGGEPDITRIDNILLQGEVVVIPEPSTYLLLGLGLISLVCLRRRRIHLG